MPLKVPVELRKHDIPPEVESLSAWFLPGSDPLNWVTLIAQLDSKHQNEARLFLIPDGGCLAIWFSHQPLAPNQFTRGFGLHPIHKKLFIPVDCRLNIEISADEVKDLFPTELAILLPGNRFFSFNKEEGKNLSQLIAPFDIKATNWNKAAAPEQSIPKLKSIEVIHQVNLEEIIDQWREDIGSSDPDELPGIPDQGDKEKKRGLRESFYESILDFTRQVPIDENRGETWVNKLEDWALDKLGGLTGRQNSELDRLIDLMRRDPDEGLKFALPLSGDAAGRGLAPPTGMLGRRNVDFSLGKLFGSGGAISPWMVDDNHYHDLLRSYREAANRELNLGRYRRAAYIFAELLGDMTSAASALEQGKNFSEAAVIYEKKLEDKKKAALCYRKAGLFSDALRLYRELDEHLEMAHLLRQLEREEEAVDCFNQAIARLLLKNQLLPAAEIANRDLSDHEQALTIYRKAWPSHSRAGDCLKQELKLLEQREEHDRVEERIRELAEGEPWPNAATQILIEQLIETGRFYPQTGVARLATDSAKVVAGKHLSRGRTPSNRILSALPNTDRGDRLLNRDARRFGKKKVKIVEDKPASPGLQVDHSLTLVVKYERSPHPPGSIPLAACGIDGQTIVASFSKANQKLHIVQSNYDQGIIGTISQDWPGTERDNIRLLPTHARQRHNVRSIYFQDESKTEFPFQDIGGPHFEVGNTTSSAEWFGVFSSETGQTWTVQTLENGEVFLQGSYLGEINHTDHIVALPPEWLSSISHVPGVCWRDQLYFGIGNRLCRWNRGEFSVIDLPSPITELATTPDYTRARIAVAMERGFTVVWGDLDWKYPERIPHEIFDEDFIRPRVAFLKSQHLVVAGQTCMGIFTVKKNTVKRNGGYAMRRSDYPILAVVPKQAPYSFEVVTSKTIFGMEATKLKK